MARMPFSYSMESNSAVAYTSRSAAEKLEHSRQSPSGARETLSGSHADSPAGTAAGIVMVRLEAGSKTRNSSRNGWLERLTMLTADAPGETNSKAVTPAGSLRLNSSHLGISYAVFCLKKKK